MFTKSLKLLFTLVLAILVAGVTLGAPLPCEEEEESHFVFVSKDDGDVFVDEDFQWIGQRAGGYLGVQLDEITKEKVKELNLKFETGAHVVKVMEESPAEKAGFRENDVIVRWNQKPVESAMQLARMVRETPAGRTVNFLVVRDGREVTVTAELGSKKALRDIFIPHLDKEKLHEYKDKFKEHGHFFKKYADMGDKHKKHVQMYAMGLPWHEKPRLGVSLMSVSGQLGAYFGLEGGEGVLITEVFDDSPADKAGLKAGDVILTVGGEKVENSLEVKAELAKVEEGPVVITVMRDKREKTFTADLEKAEEMDHFFMKNPHDMDVRIFSNDLKELKLLEGIEKIEELEKLEHLDIDVDMEEGSPHIKKIVIRDKGTSI